MSWQAPDQATYAIQCSITLRVKIGKSNDPRARFKQHQTSAPAKLLYLGILDVTERAAHEALAEYRVQGEWFEMNPTVERYLRIHLGLPITFDEYLTLAMDGHAKPPAWLPDKYLEDEAA